MSTRFRSPWRRARRCPSPVVSGHRAPHLRRHQPARQCRFIFPSAEAYGPSTPRLLGRHCKAVLPPPSTRRVPLPCIWGALQPDTRSARSRLRHTKEHLRDQLPPVTVMSRRVPCLRPAARTARFPTGCWAVKKPGAWPGCLSPSDQRACWTTPAGSGPRCRRRGPCRPRPARRLA